MISLDLARRLRAAGLAWSPTAGDRFVVPDRDMDADVFVISEMVVEVREAPSGRLLAFNGTTEWALDSIDAEQAVWLPSEGQLRDLLGATFVSIERLTLDGQGESAVGYAVTVTRRSDDPAPERHVDVDAECAYARALLVLLTNA